jgi:hypothetical protein
MKRLNWRSTEVPITIVRLPLAAKSLPYLDDAQVTFVVLEKPVTLRLGSSSADIRLEQKNAVVCAK